MRAGGPVLVVGDANPDLVLRGDVVPRFGQAEQLLTDAQFLIGGSATITAHGLARLGRPVELLAAVGTDATGERLLAELAAAGIGLGQVRHRVDVPTGLTVVLSRGVDRAILTLPGAIPTLTGDDVRAAFAGTGAAHVHVGSLFLQPGLAAELPAVLAEVRAAGATTSLDTNDDPSGRWAGVRELLPHLDLLFPNRGELERLSPAAHPQAGAAALAAAGPAVVVKDGARGAFAVPARGAGDTEQVPAPAVDVRETTGAGDTFDAAYLDAWLERRPARECLHRAVVAGALAVSASGGTAGQPTTEQLDQALSTFGAETEQDRSSTR